MGNSTGAAEHFSLVYTSGGVQFLLDGAVVLTGPAVSTGVWFYVALDYDGALWRFYYGLVGDGTADLIGTQADTIASFATNCWIGNNNTTTSPFVGYYLQIRHTRNAAIYSASAFSIPIAAFPTS